MLNAVLVGALVGLLGSLFYWRRRQELDAYGNPCLRFCGPRYGIPLVGIFFLVTGLRNLSDPFHQKYPENSLIEFGFAAFALITSIYFVVYRVSFTHDCLERHAWPLAPLRYSIDELESVEEKGEAATLRFKGARQFKISPLLSGKKAFLARVRALTSGSSDRGVASSVGQGRDR